MKLCSGLIVDICFHMNTRIYSVANFVQGSKQYPYLAVEVRNGVEVISYIYSFSVGGTSVC